MESPHAKLSSENRVPFKDGLVESRVSEIHEGQDKLHELKNDPTKIVRIEKFAKLEKRYRGEMDPIALAGLGRKLYREFETKCGISVPVEYVVGEDGGGNKVVYGIVEKIAGKDLFTTEVSIELVQEVEGLYSAISQYYLDKLSKLEEGEAVLADINHLSQYVYGMSAGDAQPRIYLVDVDLFFTNSTVRFYRVVANFLKELPYVEQKFGKQFEDVRKNIEHLTTQPFPRGLDEKEAFLIEEIVLEIKKSLNLISPRVKGENEK